MKVQNTNIFEYKFTKISNKRVPDMYINMLYNVYEDGKLPVNLNGSMNRANFLLSLFSHDKFDRLEQIKEFAKKAKLIDIHYFPAVHYSLEDTKNLEDKMYWHINIIYNSLIVNFYNTQEILYHFLPSHPKAILTVNDIIYNLVYWTSKIINEKLARYYLNKFFTILTNLNQCSFEKLVQDRMEALKTMAYDSKMNTVVCYKSDREVESLCNSYNPHFQPAYNEFAKFNMENVVTGDMYAKKLSVRIYRSKRIQLFIQEC